MKRSVQNLIILDSPMAAGAAVLEIKRPAPPQSRYNSCSTAAGLDHRSTVIIGVLLSVFVGLQLLLPLGTAVKIGADEDYELSKATLLNHGYKLYSEIWNDQPPLVTLIIANLAKQGSNPVLYARWLTVAFSLLLLSAAFALIRSVNGLLTATVATAMLMASPGFLELSCSVMQEILALAPAVTALSLLWLSPKTKGWITEVLAGLAFGFALQMKLIVAAYLPIAGLILWLRRIQQQGNEGHLTRIRQLWPAGLVFGGSLVAGFVGLNYLTGNSLMLQLQQAWAAHFANTKSFEYGSPDQFAFDWGILLRNWDTTLPALIGGILLLCNSRKHPKMALPVAWLGLSFAVFAAHKPWWPYYYLHNALPLCWCAGVGIATALKYVGTRPTKVVTRSDKYAAQLKPNWLFAAALGLFVVCASSWMAARVYLEEQAIRTAPMLYTSLVLKEINRFKPFTKFLFSDQPIYSFHAGVPMPPHLAVISLKRLWTGEMTNSRLIAELEEVKPGLILLGKNSVEVPYQELLNREYRLVFQDGVNRLYAHASIASKPAPPPL